ncbi:unnamed protein product [Ambrosiozyma monospora]|uniref:Unnamed protein product n=1 Tax=Ambrosiozyma monospora TaxID=43982 RepID=A0ACB5TZF7_AMBMO|nr:unnamed protein product [Ambrosiozyma monospora]
MNKHHFDPDVEAFEEYADDLMQLDVFQPKLVNGLSSSPLLRHISPPKPSNSPLKIYNPFDEEVDESGFEQFLNAATKGVSKRASQQFEVVPNSIPRGLLPLPDILINVPSYFESFMFYVNNTSSLLIPADVSIYKNNPFKVVLPKLAMNNDGLMSICIAFGFSHKNLLLSHSLHKFDKGNKRALSISHQNYDKDPTSVLNQLLSRSLNDLLILLQNKDTATSDLTLTLVLFMSTFIAFTNQSDKWKVHLKGAKQILLMKGYKRPFSKMIKDFKEHNHCFDADKPSGAINSEIKRSRLIYFLVRCYPACWEN